MNWRQPCGGGYGSFAIAQGLAFTIEQRREKEAVVAYALESGREVWSHDWRAHFSESMGGDGPRSTPTFEDGRVYALGAEGELCCLAASDGRVVWPKNILQDIFRPHHPSVRRRQAAQFPLGARSEEHTSELQSPDHLVCPLLLEKK